jgi:hypothetical protein
MEINARTWQRLILFTLGALILPIIVFPSSFGLQLAKGSLVYVVWELVFYGIVVYAMQRRGGLLHLLPAAGLCLVYRLFVGAALGLIIAVTYGMDVTVSLTLGLSSYLPAVLLHVAVAPFILMEVVDQFYRATTKKREKTPEKSQPVSADYGRTTLAVSRTRGFVKDDVPLAHPEPTPEPIRADLPLRETTAGVHPPNAELNGFERAVRYVGEHHSVHLAAVVDCEGLLLANHRRGDIESEDWAPLALLFVQSNGELLRRWHLSEPERLNLVLKDKRVSVAGVGDRYLMVIAERESDDLLNIRINQALEIVRKYVEERFGNVSNANVENRYVSSTQ